MPNKQAAKKYLRKSKKLALKNARGKRAIKDLQKKILHALDLKNTDEAKELMRRLQKTIDKSVKSGWLKKNTANRKKSRFAAIAAKC